MDALETRVRQWTAELRRRSPIRQAAEALMRGQPLSEETWAVLWTALEKRPGKNWKEQALAIWIASNLEMSEETRNHLHRRLREIVEARPSRSIIGLAISCSLYFVPWLVYVWAVDSKINRVRAEAARVLGTLPTAGPQETRINATVLGNAIIEMKNRTASEDKKARIAAAMALPSLLRQLPYHGYADLPPKIAWALHRLVKDQKPDVVLSILESLRLLEDTSILPQVETLAQKHSDLLVREAAKHTCEALHTARRNATLLRPSYPSGTSAEHLLRPASGVQEAQAELLLRATTDGAAEPSSADSSHALSPAPPNPYTQSE